ncbi:MAG TPA: hypothetical protein VIK86_01825 [Candidatus Paceibacterota bacterium]
MDIKELDKKQLILLTLLITFVVSIGTGIVTVSLMNQMPKSVPQTINNVIQRTIEKVTTVETPAKVTTSNNSIVQDKGLLIGDGDTVVSIYPLEDKSPAASTPVSTVSTTGSVGIVSPVVVKELGQGIIISDVGLVLVDSSILNESQNYKIILNKTDFNASVLKKFNNGFTVLKITEKKSVVKTPEVTTSIDTTNKTQ